MYGDFPLEHQDALRSFLQDRAVLDLGCGDGERAHILAELGAGFVLGVDSQTEPESRYPHAAFQREHFHQIEPAAYDVGHLAWPVNHPTTGLMNLLAVIPCVIYVGSNVRGNACGTVPLFAHFLRREILEYKPSFRNSLIVYGPVRGGVRTDVVHEEWAVLQQVEPLSFDDTLERRSIRAMLPAWAPRSL